MELTWRKCGKAQKSSQDSWSPNQNSKWEVCEPEVEVQIQKRRHVYDQIFMKWPNER
jgi:hypothetical protein